MVKSDITYIIINEIFTKCVYISSDAVMKTVAKATAMAYPNHKRELQRLDPNSRSFTHDKEKIIHKMEKFEAKHSKEIRDIMNYRRSALNGRVKKQYLGDYFVKFVLLYLCFTMRYPLTNMFYHFFHIINTDLLKSIYFKDDIDVPDMVHINESFSLYDSLTKLRMTDKSNKNDYYFVLQFFKTLLHGVSRVNYLKDYKKACMNSRISEIVTEDEEALALWFMDNSELKWRNKFLLKVGKDQFQDKVKLCESKYTRCMSGHHPFQGWSNEGIERYSEIRQFVKENRSSEQGKLFEEQFMMSQRNGTGQVSASYDANRPSKEIAHSLHEISYEKMFESLNQTPEMPALESHEYSASQTSALSSLGIPRTISTNGSKTQSSKSKFNYFNLFHVLSHFSNIYFNAVEYIYYDRYHRKQ